MRRVTLVYEYEKLPVKVKVLKFEHTPDGIKELLEFAGDAVGGVYAPRAFGKKAELQIRTLEDGKYFKAAHIATEGDYIIQGVKGEFYACKPDIFDATYRCCT
jgi:hypothetical protein